MRLIYHIDSQEQLLEEQGEMFVMSVSVGDLDENRPLLVHK